jgi:immune inhibitor A
MQIITKMTFALALVLVLPMVSGANSEGFNKPLDHTLIDKGRIAYWLEKRGEISSQDTPERQQAKVDQFINLFQSNNQRSFRLPKKYQRRDIVHGSKQSKNLTKISAVNAINTQVKVLAILIDFPDLPYNNNRLEVGDTDLFYSEYSAEHYRNLLYSQSGFAGPNGENFISAKQYYQQESGNSFDFSGTVLGWYRAKNTSDFYGTNVGANDKNAESLVVEAIEAAVEKGNIDLKDYDKKDPLDINENGNFDEPDGEIDHVLIIHSSIGEESGGGVLGSSAIWSHRFSIDESQSAITGSTIKVRNYTIQPIDSGAGVVVHEFGHDLGLDDEYDLKSTIIGAPVGSWSVMSAGSWLGDLRGTQPTVFSPLGREKLQESFGGNWINQKVIKASDLTKSALDVTITQASNHNGAVNQVKIELPARQEFFGQPQQGSYQLLADHKNQANFRYTKIIEVPDVANVTLSLWAKWNIDNGYDYAQIIVDGQALFNDFTTVNSPNISGVTHFITGKLAGTPWTELKFDMSVYRNKKITLYVDYVTDATDGGFGLSIDNIALIYNGKNHLVEGFEQTDEQPKITGEMPFSRITAYKDAAPDYYYVQLRSQAKLDIGLKGNNYEPGIVIWYGNEAYNDNNSSVHPGFGFISVVDADQSLIKHGDTEKQVRDAAFSLYPQASIPGDNHLEATNEFNDANDYSNKEQSQSGTKLPLWGINLLITEQATDNNTATISLSRTDFSFESKIAETINDLVVSFTHQTTSNYSLVSYLWDFGDGNTSPLAQPTHTYRKGGDYSVSLEITDTTGANIKTIKKVSISAALDITTTNTLNGFDVTLSSSTTGGVTPYTYLWDFGDDTTSSLSALTHSYSKVGNYTVTLSVTDAIGQQKKKNLDLTIKSTISVDFSHKITNQIVSFVGTVTDPIGNTTIKWDFGDNGTSTELSPTHNYATVGNYVVKIAASDDSGTTKTLSKNITISPVLKSTSDSKSGGALGMFLFVMLALTRVRKLRESR